MPYYGDLLLYEKHRQAPHTCTRISMLIADVINEHILGTRTRALKCHDNIYSMETK